VCCTATQPAAEAVKKLLDQNITQVTEIRRLGRGQSIPLPNLQIFLACVISGSDLIFHSFYRAVLLTLLRRNSLSITRSTVGENDQMKNLNDKWKMTRFYKNGRDGHTQSACVQPASTLFFQFVF